MNPSQLKTTDRVLLRGAPLAFVGYNNIPNSNEKDFVFHGESPFRVVVVRGALGVEMDGLSIPKPT